MIESLEIRESSQSPWRGEEHDFEDGWADPPAPLPTPGTVTDRDEVEPDADPDEIVD